MFLHIFVKKKASRLRGSTPESNPTYLSSKRVLGDSWARFWLVLDGFGMGLGKVSGWFSGTLGAVIVSTCVNLRLTVGQHDEQLFKALAKMAERRLGQFNALELANTSWALTTPDRQSISMFSKRYPLFPPGRLPRWATRRNSCSLNWQLLQSGR